MKITRHTTAIEPLYDLVFPGLPAGIQRAAELGADWADMTTPFVELDPEGRTIAHVGVLSHDMVVEGETLTLAGIHAVATHPEHRRRGLCRGLLREALSWADQRAAGAKLSTDDPPVYTSSGFATMPVHRFRVVARNTVPQVTELRPLRLSDSEDLALVTDRLRRRAPISARLATLDTGWLTLINAALHRVSDRWFYFAPAIDAVLVADAAPKRWTIHDVVAAQLPNERQLLSALPPTIAVDLAFTPDLVAPNATAHLRDPADGEFMTRGWRPSQPIGVPLLWEH